MVVPLSFLLLYFQLLLFICGSKEKYRELRDLHSIETNLTAVMEQCRKSGLVTTDVNPHSVILPYDSLLVLVSGVLRHIKMSSKDPDALRPVHY